MSACVICVCVFTLTTCLFGIQINENKIWGLFQQNYKFQKALPYNLKIEPGVLFELLFSLDLVLRIRDPIVVLGTVLFFECLFHVIVLCVQRH